MKFPLTFLLSMLCLAPGKGNDGTDRGETYGRAKTTLKDVLEIEKRAVAGSACQPLPVFLLDFFNQKMKADSDAVNSVASSSEVTDDSTPMSNEASIEVEKPYKNLPERINPWCKADCHPKHSPIFRIDSISLSSQKNNFFSTSIDSGSKDIDDDDEFFIKPTVLFPSMRLLVAVLLCCCYITLSISSSNIAVALICMIKCPVHHYGGDLEWHSDQVIYYLPHVKNL